MDYKTKTIEEKAQAYDKAIKVIKGNLDALNEITETGAEVVNIQSIKNSFYKAFPELSEDEKIRKEIMSYIQSSGAVTNKQWIAWLEKQGKLVEYYEDSLDRCACKNFNKGYKAAIEHQKEKQNESSIYNVPSREVILAIWDLGNEWKELTNYCISTEYGTQLDYIQKHWEESEYYLRAKQDEQKPADSVEPKFREGDWIVQENIGTYKVIEVCESWYEVIDVEDNHYSIAFDKEYMCRPWTIQDAKDGDVLASNLERNYISPFIAIYKERGLDFFNSYCFIGLDGKFYKGDTGHDIVGIHPATPEQRDLLFAKMKEAGYEWDADKKELRNK